MEIKLKYGSGHHPLSLPDKALVSILKPAALPPLPDIRQALMRSLKNPLGRGTLAEQPSLQSVAIAVPDESRPVPVTKLLPLLIDHLLTSLPHLTPSGVSVIVGGGLHPPMSSRRLREFLPPEVAMGCKVSAHDANNSPVISFGRTTQGTPVEINQDLGRADLKIVLGQVDPHQFVGFTGGSKGVTVGCASAAMIEHNHGLMFMPGASVGRLQGNPVREDLNEAGRMIGLDLAVDVVMDPDKRPVGLWAGEPEAVLTAAADTCSQVYGVALDEPFDLVIASCGGYPKDICLYQSQKGLNLASQALKPGGKILLLAQCDQGVGDDVYFDYVCRFGNHQEALKDFEACGFRMGAHKSFLFGRTLSRFEAVVHSDLDQSTLRQCHLTPGDAQRTLDRWIGDFEGNPRVAVVPSANNTYFVFPETS